MKKIIKLYLGFCLAAFLLTVWSLECRAAEEYTDLTEGAEYSDDGVLYHPDGDGILISDYTLPENMRFEWYNGNLTIASGVTLTIPEGSMLFVSNETQLKFTLEEGACIRIEGAPDINEWGEPKERLEILFAKAYINGTIESDSTGIHCRYSKVYLNGTIHSVQPAVLARECQVSVLGGEYLSNSANNPIMNMDPDCQSVIEIRGGVFSGKGDRSYLLQGYTYEEHPNGVIAAPIPSASETSTVNEEKGIVKEQIQGIIDYAKGLFMEAKSDSVTEDGNWLNGDIIVVILCVATVLIILIYVIFDFIRSPWKKKIKILLELIIAIGLVGSVLWYFWNQAVGEQQKSSANDSYQEDTLPEKILIKNNASLLNDLEAYPEGIYHVGKDLEPGIYFFEASDPNESNVCFYIYFSRKEDFKEKEVGAWVRRCYVELKNGEYIHVQDANFVKSGEQPAYQSQQEATAITYPKGEYLVGYDIMPGSYQVETENDICVRDTAINGSEVNFSIYSRENYMNGDHIELKEGQYVNTGIWEPMTLTGE